MALSNRDKVDRGLAALADGLRPFVERHMSAAAPAGQDWVAMLEARDAAKHGSAKKLSTEDPRFLLRVLTEEWRAFGSDLSRVDSSYASELRDAANRLYHHESFSSDDTTRALDTIERLLTSIGAPDQAAMVQALRVEHQRAAYEELTRKTVRAAVGTVSTPGTGLKPWREVIAPHPDVVGGAFNAAEYAADLHHVATGQTQAPEYADAVEFFARTYLTEGLRDLLSRAVRRISGDPNASPIVNLQTNFGGGKTHSMLAVYHLFSGRPAREFPQAVQDIVGPVDLTAMNVRRVTLVGTHLAPNQPRVKDDGTEVRTLWGELAWQLGGRAAYDTIADSDRAGTPPGDALAALLREHAPALILIDEWVAYARGLSDEPGLAGGMFDSQFTFAQSLTEAVSAIPGAMLLVSIPASDTLDAGGPGSAIEVGGERGRRALAALQNVVGRKADHWRAASSLESFEIVRRRLFVEPDAAARTDIAAVARQFVTFYRENHGQFPREAEDAAYEDRLKAAYPIHPELFDRLYEDWSTLERFQRTRGVLRLMSIVIHQLWSAGDASPLIMPGSVPLQAPLLNAELTNYLPDVWKPIIDTDIDGEGSTPVAIDASRSTFGARSLTRRIARTIFLGSAATLGTDHKGVERPRVWLGVAVPGDAVGNFGASLEVLGQQATYLYSENARYWFSTTASVTRTASDIADRLRQEPERVWAEVVARLRVLARDRGGFAGVHVAPDGSGDVPDTDEARLVVIHPRWRHARGESDSEAMNFATECLARAGSGQRRYRNMVVFAAADQQRWDDLDAAVRNYLAWSQVDSQAAVLNLTSQQAAQASTRRSQAEEDVTNRLRATYTYLLVPVQDPPTAPPTVRADKIGESATGLAVRATDKLVRGGDLASDYGAFSVRMALDGPLSAVWASGHVSVGELWSLYAQYPYLDRLRDRSVLEAALLSVLTQITWNTEGFALAAGFEDGRYQGLVLPGDSSHPTSLADSWLLVRADLAIQQRDAELADAGSAEPPAPSESDGADVETEEGGGSTGPTPPSTPTRPTRYFGSVRVDPERYGRDFGRIGQEIIQHLAAAPGIELQITVDIQARTADGFTPEAVRTIGENAATLKFDVTDFEHG